MTKDENKTKAQLLAELRRTRRQLAKAEAGNVCAQSPDDKFRLLTENSVAGIFIIQDAQMAYVNPSMGRLLGYQPGEIVGKLTLKDLVHPDDIELAMQRMQERLESRIEERSIAYKAVKKDGSLVYIEVYAQRTEFMGRPAVMGTVIDVTERKIAEDKLRLSEGLNRKLVENSPDIIAILDPKGKFISINRVVKGYKKKDVIGMHTSDFVPMEYRESHDKAFKNAAEENMPGIVEFSDNLNNSFLCRYLPFQQVHGEKLLMGITTDVTERKQVEEAYRVLVNTSLQGAVILQKNRIVFANPAAERISGYSIEELLNIENPIQTLIHPDDLPAIMRRVEQRARGEKFPPFVQYRIVQKSGKPSWVESQTAPIIFRGEPAEHTVYIDISERKRTEEALRENEMLFSLLLQNSPVYIFFKDKNMRSLRLSANFEQMLGMPVVEALGKSMEELFPSELAHNMVEDDRRILEKGKLVQVHETLNDRHYETIKFPILKDGKPDMLAGFTVDITERKRAEQALQRSEEKYRAIMENTGTAVCIMDWDSTVTYANNAFQTLTGFSQEEIEGKKNTLDFLLGVDRKSIAGIREKRMIGEQIPDMYDLELITRNGETKNVIAKLHIIPHSNQFVVSFLDITERKRMERQLHQSEKMQAIGQLAGGIAHDFNNQLFAILGLTNMLRHDAADAPDTIQTCDDIIRCVDRAADLTKKLLAFSRMGNYVLLPVDAHRLIIEVTEVLRRTVDKRIQIKQHLDASALTVFGDASQLQNALLNLGLNARDAMPEGGKLLFGTQNVILHDTKRDSTGEELPPGKYVSISVSDTGTGIPEENLESIFEPFFTTKEAGKGTGMGLAAVYGTVTSHGGTIEVQNAPGKGTTFTMLLPIHEQAAPSKRVSDEREVARGQGNILFVDDDDFICEVARNMLASLGYNVKICRDGKQAVECFCSSPQAFDLVILDMVMPGLSGKEAFEQMKRLHPAVKVLVSSGYSPESGLQEVLDAGASGFIQKPFRRASLGQKIAEILGCRWSKLENMELRRCWQAAMSHK